MLILLSHYFKIQLFCANLSANESYGEAESYPIGG
jgi:hypothetical protein